MSVGKGAAAGMAGGAGGNTTGLPGAAADYDLLQRMAAGDETALAALYDRYCRLIMSVALAVEDTIWVGTFAGDRVGYVKTQ